MKSGLLCELTVSRKGQLLTPTANTSKVVQCCQERSAGFKKMLPSEHSTGKVGGRSSRASLVQCAGNCQPRRARSKYLLKFRWCPEGLCPIWDAVAHTFLNQ